MPCRYPNPVCRSFSAAIAGSNPVARPPGTAQDCTGARGGTPPSIVRYSEARSVVRLLP
jgi:hypothetical protein